MIKQHTRLKNVQQPKVSYICSLANYMNHTLLSSPLQGFTDFRFRNAFHKFFGGIDTFYAPYIRLNGKLVIKPSYERDLLPENNVGLEVIPQIITNNAFVNLSKGFRIL